MSAIESPRQPDRESVPQRGPAERAAARAATRAFWLGCGLLLGLVALVLANAGAPALPTQPAPPGEFSIVRAVEHVRALTATPGQTGSAGNAARRRYIVERLGALGVDAQVQSTDAVVRLLGKVVAVQVHNVVARIPGSEPGKAIMLSAHYDTVPNSPGASDDGAGVATLLETARVLRAGPTLRRDVVLLFTDGEELGLLGADAFVSEHPLRAGVDVALNFEARGASGASAMYETSLPNRELIRALGRAVPDPVGNSLLSSLSRALPNDTDFTIFRQHGIAGYAFAYADDFTRYHRHTDTVEHLDSRSLQHHGSYATHLARALANTSAGPTEMGDAVYFDLLGKCLVWYPDWLAKLAGALSGVLAIVVVVWAWRLGWLKLGPVAWGVLGCLLSLLLAVVGAIALDLALGLVLTKDRRVEWASWLFAGHLALAIAICFQIYRVLLRRASGAELLLGSLLWGAALALIFGLWLPGASYAPTWVTLAGLVGWWGAHRWAEPRRAGAADDRGAVWIWWAALVPAAYFVASVGYAVFVLMGTQLPPAATLAVGWGAALFLPWSAARWLAHVRRLQLGLLGACAAVALVAIVASRGAASPPVFSDLVYLLEADSGRAHWVASPPLAADWTRQALGDAPKSVQFWPPKQHLAATAPAVTFASSRLVLTSDARDRGERRVTFVLEPATGARCVSLQQLEGAAARAVSVNGKAPHVLTRFGERADRELWHVVTGERLADGLSLRYCGLDGRPLHIELVTFDQPLKLRVLDESDGLPDSARALPPRPSNLHFDINGNRSMVSRDVLL